MCKYCDPKPCSFDCPYERFADEIYMDEDTPVCERCGAPLVDEWGDPVKSYSTDKYDELCLDCHFDFESVPERFYLYETLAELKKYVDNLPSDIEKEFFLEDFWAELSGRYYESKYAKGVRG